MKGDSFNSRIIDGTYQKDREPLAFQSGYFNADEMSFEMLLSMASEYAASFNYYNVVNQKDGHWDSLFNANEVVIMALIATTDLERMTSDFSRLETANINVPAEYVVRVASMLDFWLQHLAAASTDSAALLRRDMHDMASANLLPGLHTAAEIIYRSDGGPERLSEINIAALSPLWNIASNEQHYRFEHAVAIESNNHFALMEQLELALLKMVESIRYLKKVVSSTLEQSLKGQSHEPAIGLYMVFLKLYTVAQKRLNQFTERHLDFYYRDCLQTRPRDRKTESLFLRFEPAPSAKPFVVDKALEFTSEKNVSEDSILYQLKDPLLVRRASVTSLKTLYLQRNRLMSPERELGHVTRMKLYERTLPSDDGGEQLNAMPVFGNVKSGMSLVGMTDARVGFCVASPILALKEGRREIDVTLDFIVPGEGALKKLFSESSFVDSIEGFNAWFGQVFSYYLLMGEAFLNRPRREKLNELIARYDNDHACEALISKSWQDIFYHLFKRPFLVSLSGENGWLAVSEYLVSPAIEDDNGNNSGLKLTLSLDHSDEAVVPYDRKIHGGDRDCELPMINILLDPESSFFSYSLLNSMVVNSIEIDVAVEGVKDVVVSNHLGRLDAAKPFAPFGPLPTRHSYMVVGSREAAGKQATSMELAIEWGDLPTLSGGFSSHYQDYDFVPLNADFKAEVSVLQNGNWMPGKADTQYRVGLFQSGDGGVVAEKSLLTVGAIDYFKPLDAIEVNQRYEYRSGARNGFVKFQMTSPENGFGHADYPHLLTRVLSENSRRKKPLPVPQSPYTPQIKNISLNYKAHSLIRVVDDVSLSSQSLDERFFHVHPFGVEQAYPVAIKGKVHLFPIYKEDGNLFIGIESSQLIGTLNLFFDLADDATKISDTKTSEIRWRCLTATGWVLLEQSRVLSDSTEGFLVSGVVTLELPADMASDSLVVAPGQYWLQVSTNGALDGFAGLRAVYTNVGQLECSVKTVPHDGIKTFDLNAVWRALTSVPGLAAVSAIGRASGGRAAESDAQYKTRVSERLRHKGRASTAWDYERLVLERFPDLYKVKCFPNTVCNVEAASPGNVLIVVVPDVTDDARCEYDRGMVNGAELLRIRQYLQPLVSPFVKVAVINPVYERIQVRCTVKFAGDINVGGAYIKRLNRAISDYIYPWCDMGYKAKFGWAIRADDIESYIRELDYVDFVTNFSMLHITEEENETYRLMDTVKWHAMENNAEQCNRHEALIKPRYPWSLAVPMRRHYIETTMSIEPIAAKETGVNELEIGSTFIIGRN